MKQRDRLTGKVTEHRIVDDVEVIEKWDEGEVLRLIELYEADGGVLRWPAVARPARN